MQRTPAPLRWKVGRVNCIKFAVETAIVGAKFDQLRVGEFEQVEDNVCIGGAVIYECGIPLHNDEVIGKVTEVQSQRFGLFFGREFLRLSQHEFDQRRPVVCEQRLGFQFWLEILDGGDKVIFHQRYVRLIKRGSTIKQHLFEELARDIRQPIVLAQFYREISESGPWTGVLEPDANGNDAVVVDLDACRSRPCIEHHLWKVCREWGNRELDSFGRRYRPQK